MLEATVYLVTLFAQLWQSVILEIISRVVPSGCDKIAAIIFVQDTIFTRL